MKIALITDAWQPQVNGVVRTWNNIVNLLREQGDEVLVIHPAMFRTVPCPGYTAIRLALRPGRRTVRMLDEFRPDAIHIATEGPIGLVARRYCVSRGLPFTSSYHTQFPHYLRMYFGIPQGMSYRFMRWFHRRAARTLVPTESVRAELEHWNFNNVVLWKRGVNREHFRPKVDIDLGLPRPVFLNVGRVSSEKNLAAFASLDLPGSKVIVGDGPALPGLRRRYPNVTWTGYLPDDRIPDYYAGADVFVFPSRTDTFGNVMLEALACGTPVAAYPVTGPIDLVQPGVTGVLSEDLGAACMQALELDRHACRAATEEWTWPGAAEKLKSYLYPVM